MNECLQNKYPVQVIYHTEAASFSSFQGTTELISLAEMKKITHLKNPSPALAICSIEKQQEPSKEGLHLVLDSIRDPGNLGTLLRLADWFGLSSVICSENSVDVYNPKTIQASMGSFARIPIHYTNLVDFLTSYSGEIIGTFLSGESLYHTTNPLPSEGLLILGSEANGISTEVEALCTRKITIPQFGLHKNTESLNIALAGSIVLGEFFSQQSRI